MAAVFSNGGQIRTDPGELLSAGECAKGTGYFLLNLDHADVLFGLVVGERNAVIGQERED